MAVVFTSEERRRAALLGPNGFGPNGGGAWGAEDDFYPPGQRPRVVPPLIPGDLVFVRDKGGASPWRPGIVEGFPEPAAAATGGGSGTRAERAAARKAARKAGRAGGGTDAGSPGPTGAALAAAATGLESMKLRPLVRLVGWDKAFQWDE